jgi:hypothetical protein
VQKTNPGRLRLRPIPRHCLQECAYPLLAHDDFNGAIHAPYATNSVPQTQQKQMSKRHHRMKVPNGIIDAQASTQCSSNAVCCNALHCGGKRYFIPWHCVNQQKTIPLPRSPPTRRDQCSVLHPEKIQHASCEYSTAVVCIINLHHYKHAHRPAPYPGSRHLLHIQAQNRVLSCSANHFLKLRCGGCCCCYCSGAAGIARVQVLLQQTSSSKLQDLPEHKFCRSPCPNLTSWEHIRSSDIHGCSRMLTGLLVTATASPDGSPELVRAHHYRLQPNADWTAG